MKLSLIGIFVALGASALVALAGGQGSVELGGIPLFMLCACVGFALHWVMFIPAYIFKSEHYFDLTGMLSFVGALLLATLGHPDLSLYGLIIAILIGVWSVRLGMFLFVRVRRSGGDSRFVEIKTDFFRFLLTWTLGGAWVFLTAAAGLAAMTSDAVDAGASGIMSDAVLGRQAWFAWLGLAVWLIGFAIEVVADAQKSRFRKNSANAHKFITSGLWAVSRHPNYFGEIVLWFGIALMAVPALEGWQWVVLISPVVVALLLTRVSGVNLLEAQAEQRWGQDLDYQQYKSDTPVLWPRRLW